MRFLNRLVAVVLAAGLAAPMAPLEAKTKKGDRYLAEGRVHEAKKEWDAALEAYRRALAEDPAEMLYQMSVDKTRFQDGQMHLDRGLQARAHGQLGDALLEFQKAFAIDPGSSVARQEIALTQEMIARERQRVEQTGKPSTPDERALTPAEEARKRNEEKLDRILPVPELKPLNDKPISHLQINGQPVKVLYETIGKVALFNVLWDPDFAPPTKNTFNLDLENSTLDEALNDVAIITKTYWKPLSPNTIFVTNDNPNKRRDYAEMVAQTFYLTNVSSPQEIQEIVNAVRSIAGLQRVVAFTSQSAIIVRGESDEVALAGKMIHDLDRPRPEVVVDILVMEASSSFTRQITAAIASTGLNLPFTFSPRSSIQVQSNSSTTTSTTTSSTTSTATTASNGTTTGSSTSGTQIPLSNLGHLSSADFATTLPSALLQAALSDAKTKVLQAPQLRSVDGVKATLKIGQREPTASGSFQPGIGGVGINPLVNTQFQYIDVGVNVVLLPHVHDNGDISMDIDLDISTIAGNVNLGGINQPIIGQRKVTHSVRMHEGEVSLLAGLVTSSDSKTVTGIPGLANIPVLGKLFSGDSVDRERDEVMIVLIPHIVRQPVATAEELRGIATGNQNAVKLNYAPAPSDVISGPQAAAALAGGAPAEAPATAPVPSATMPPATAPPAMAPPATVPPAAMPPATAPPATAPPAFTPPATMPTTTPRATAPAMPPIPGITVPPATVPPATAPAATAPATVPPAAPVSAGTASGAVVRFAPDQMQVPAGGQVSVRVMVDRGTDVASAPMQIRFDPKVLHLNDITRGGFLARGSAEPVFTKNIMNDSGTATVQLGLPPGAAGANGSGELVTLNFQAVGRGNTTVTIQNLLVKNSHDQTVVDGSPQMTVSVQ